MMRVLVRLPNHVGDACMALPAIRALQDAGCSCVLLGRAWGESLFAGLQLPYRVLDNRVLADSARLRSLVRATRDDVRGLIFPNSFGSALAFALAGVRSAGLATRGRGVLLRWASAEPAPCHEVERFHAAAAAALRAWDRPAPDAPSALLGLRPASAQRSQARAVLEAQRIARRYALLAPVATGLHHGQAKHWAHFPALVPALRERALQPVAAPPAHEAAAVRAALPEAILLPPVELGVYAALARYASLVIANDSGSSHVAAAVGARQVTIFGVTDRARTAPWSPRAVCVGDNGAWPSVDDVVAAIDRALAMADTERE